MTLWPVPTKVGYSVLDDTPAPGRCVPDEFNPKGTAPAGSDEDAIVTLKPFWYQINGFDGGKIHKSTPRWYCWRDKSFDCSHAAAAAQDHRERRGV